MSSSNYASSSPAAGRTYDDAIRLLSVLQSNRAIASSISSSNVDMNAQAIPEMIDWTRKAGYELHDFAKGGLKCIHVAGTKGKGSVCIMVESILAQYQKNDADPSVGERKKLGKIGVYTSPHLITTCERIRIDGSPISEDLFTKYFFDLWDRFTSAASSSTPPHPDPESAETKPGYFRFLTIMAFHTFLQEGVQTAIVECGIGGEYDSTNILPPEAVTVSAITKLGIDHVGMLGGTIEEIAWHKAGIMKPGVPAFTVPQTPGAQTVLESRAAEKEVKLVVQERLPFFDLEKQSIGLEGDFQKDNASLAVAVAATHLKSAGLLSNEPIMPNALPEKFQLGLRVVEWPGRCQVREEGNVTWLLDGAHTHESLKEAAEWYCEKLIANREDAETLQTFLIFSQQDRDAVALLKTLLRHIHLKSKITSRAFTYAAFCPYAPFKASTGSDEDDTAYLGTQESLADAYSLVDRNTLHMIYSSIDQAVELVKTISNSSEKDKLVVLATGSLYLVSGVLQNLDRSATGKDPNIESQQKGRPTTPTDLRPPFRPTHRFQSKYGGTNPPQVHLYSTWCIQHKSTNFPASRNWIRCNSTKASSKIEDGKAANSSTIYKRHLQSWTPDEDLKLAKMRSEKVPYKTIGMLLQRSIEACKTHHRDMSLVKRPESWSPRPRTAPWTDKDTQILLEKRVDGLGWKAIGLLLGRTSMACRTRHGRVVENSTYQHKPEPITYWTKVEDKKVLLLRAQGLTFTKIATHLDRSDDACRSRYITLTSSKERLQNWVPWTINELTLLVDCRAERVPFSTIATRLNRTMSSVKNKWYYLKKEGEAQLQKTSKKLPSETAGD